MDIMIFPETSGGEPAPVRYSEFRHRRHGWSGGPQVLLADGMIWSLPPIDLGLLLACPELQRELCRAYDLASDVQLQPDGSKEHAIKLVLYHAHMAKIAARLLQANYALPDDGWSSLLKFRDLHAMMAMTSRVSEEIVRTIPVWIPFFVLDGQDRRELLALN